MGPELLGLAAQPVALRGTASQRVNGARGCAASSSLPGPGMARWYSCHRQLSSAAVTAALPASAVTATQSYLTVKPGTRRMWHYTCRS